MAAALMQSKQLARNDPPITPRGASDVVAVRTEFDLADNGGAVEINDVIEMVILPAGCVPVDVILDTDDLDTNGAPTITFDVGVMAGDITDRTLGNRTPGTEFFSAVNTPQTGGLARPTLKTATRVAPDNDKDCAIGILVKAGPATGAATGKVGLTVFYRPAIHGA